MSGSSAELSNAALQRWAGWMLGQLSGLWAVALDDAQIEISRRMRRSLGRCYPARGLIRLHAGLLERDQRASLRETLIHEAAHLAAWRKGGRDRPHGELWQTLMRTAGQSDRATCPTDRALSTPRPPSVRLQCRDCGTVYLRRRSDRRWRCRICQNRGLEGQLLVHRLTR